MTPKQAVGVAKDAISAWLDDRAPSMGAALAYYTIFSIAPLLVIAVGLVGWIMGHHPGPAHDNPIVRQVTSLIGGEGGKAIENMVMTSFRYILP